MIFTRRALPIIPLALVGALLAAGCGKNDGVNSYDVPKATDSGKKDTADAGPAPAAGGEYRILGGIFPAGNPQWFFKLTGPAEALATYEAGFDKLLTSVTLPPQGPPGFVTPEGWTRGFGRAGIVVATLRTPDGKYEVTVTSSAGGVEPNLKRWADQLGVVPFGPGEIDKCTKRVDAQGVTGLRVDMRGPKNPAGAMGGPFTGKK